MLAKEITAGLLSKKLTLKEVGEYFVGRVQKCEGLVHAWESIDIEYIKNFYFKNNQMSWNHQLQPLFGIPIGVKDCYNTYQYPTRRGSEIYQNYMAGNDARIIRKALDEGCFLFGKTTTAELSVHEPSKTINPYDAKHTPGTSSGGSAVAVATGMVPIAFGTQTAASTSKPCSYCGVYGFKPTFGLFPRTGVLKTSDTLDTLTLMGRSHEDIEYLFKTIAIRGKNYPFINKGVNENKPLNEKVKVALIVESHLDIQETVKKAMSSLAIELKEISSISIEVIELPDFLKTVHSNHEAIYNKSVSYYFKEEYESHKNLLSKSLIHMIEAGQNISLKDYKNILAIQAEHISLFHEWMANYDFVVSPASNGAAPVGKYDHEMKDFSLIWTYLGVPLLIAPKFYDEKKMPFGFQVSSAKYSDYELFRFFDLLKDKKIIKDVMVIDPK